MWTTSAWCVGRCARNAKSGAQALDQARATFEAQQAHVESLLRQVEVQRAAVALALSNVDQITVRRSQLQAMERQQAAAGAQTSKAQVRLDYTEIDAPIAGVISVLAARQGEVVNVGPTDCLHCQS